MPAITSIISDGFHRIAYKIWLRLQRENSVVVYKADWLDGQFDCVRFEPDGKRVICWKPLKVDVKVMNPGNSAEEEFSHEVRNLIIFTF